MNSGAGWQGDGHYLVVRLEEKWDTKRWKPDTQIRKYDSAKFTDCRSIYPLIMNGLFVVTVAMFPFLLQGWDGTNTDSVFAVDCSVTANCNHHPSTQVYWPHRTVVMDDHILFSFKCCSNSILSLLPVFSVPHWHIRNQMLITCSQHKF